MTKEKNIIGYLKKRSDWAWIFWTLLFGLSYWNFHIDFNDVKKVGICFFF